MPHLILEPEFYVDEDGKIHHGKLSIPQPSWPQKRTLKLRNQVLLPGFVNTHSHGFQRFLRGLVEQKSNKEGNTFWQWRHQMYHLANKISHEQIYIMYKYLFIEMLQAGFTHVGEFNYLHHDFGQKDPLAISKNIVKAALDTGINLCLLSCAYNRNNFDEPMKAEQKRFCFEQVQDFLAFSKELRANLVGENISHGLAIHSVRAVPESWFAPILNQCQSENLPLHIHASEQKKEVSDCIFHTKHSPIAWLAKHHLLTPKTTLIHALQLMSGDLELLKKYQPHISLCPSTEKNLGDGLAPLSDFLQAKLKISIGSDQNLRLNPFMEAISLEENERLRLLERSCINRNGGWLFEHFIKTLSKFGHSSLYPTRASSSSWISVELPAEYLWHKEEVALEALFLSPCNKIKTIISNGNLIQSNSKDLESVKTSLVNDINKFIIKK